MSPEEKVYADLLTDAVAAADPDAAGAAVRKHSTFCFGDSASSGELSDPFVRHLVTLIARPDVQKMRGSFQIVSAVHSDWGRFSDPQRALLEDALLTHYPSFRDAAARLLIVEILGQWSPEPRGIQGLRALFEQPLSPPAKATLVHGFRRFLARSGDPLRAAEARQILDTLARDEDSSVREEATRVPG